MLSFTGAGAVESPTAVQVRATATPIGKLAAGAPLPSRDLSLEEIVANLRWFAVDRVGPRASAIQRAVLSGITRLADWPSIIPQARAWGFRTLAVHAAPVPGIVGIDEWVVVVDAPDRVTPGIRAVIPLAEPALAELPAIVTACVTAGVRSVAFTLPFPSADGQGVRPELAEVVRRIASPVAQLRRERIAVGIKGIPPCLLSGLEGPAELAWRTPNRWYVDADHQRDRALLFLPDVVRFAKTEDCRRCFYVARCDGVAEGWLRAGVVARLVPMASAT